MLVNPISPPPSPYSIRIYEDGAEHKWAVVQCTCDLSDENDLLTLETTRRIRSSYGEDAVVRVAHDLLAKEIALGDFNLDHLVAALRTSLPNPAAEGGKPVWLTNYRSQAAEMLAKGALNQAFNFIYPVAPQEASSNPNQPILGFDGWGVLKEDDGYRLVLIQVKATDEDRRPPGEARKLIEECKRIPGSHSQIIRALMSMVRLLQGEDNSELQRALLFMIEGFTRHELPNIFVSPAIVRGKIAADISDLSTIRGSVADYAPALGRGVSISIGVSLEDFGRVAMERARRAA